MLISDAYRLLNREYHAAKENYGTSGVKQAGRVRILATEKGCATILDYGCGKGTLKTALPDLNITEYDPAIEGKDAHPEGTYDMVVALHVLENVEPEYLDVVLADIKALAGKIVFLAISTTPAVKIFPDGRNTHLTVENKEWWLNKLDAYFDGGTVAGEKVLVISARPRA